MAPNLEDDVSLINMSSAKIAKKASITETFENRCILLEKKSGLWSYMKVQRVERDGLVGIIGHGSPLHVKHFSNKSAFAFFGFEKFSFKKLICPHCGEAVSRMGNCGKNSIFEYVHKDPRSEHQIACEADMVISQGVRACLIRDMPPFLLKWRFVK